MNKRTLLIIAHKGRNRACWRRLAYLESLGSRKHELVLLGWLFKFIENLKIPAKVKRQKSEMKWKWRDFTFS